MAGISTNVSIKTKSNDGGCPSGLYKMPQPQYEHPPMVLIVGWLGCKPKNLERYAKLYTDMGMIVITKIPSPSTVIIASVTSVGSSHAESSSLLHDDQQEEPVKFPMDWTTMQDLAQSTISEIFSVSTKYSKLVIHVFSNGGAFLWEAIRHKLQREESMKKKLNLCGIIFDSAPGDYCRNPNTLLDAIQYCPPEERIQLHAYLQERRDVLGQENELTLRKERAKQYWEGMKDCTIQISHLYICSRVDTLAPFDSLWGLIKYRLSKPSELPKEFGRRPGDMTKYLIFEDSAHCSHLLKYAEEYRSCIASFLNHCFHCEDADATISSFGIKSRL